MLLSEAKKSPEVISGIYKITNTENGKVYIGQSVNIYKRWVEHKRAAFNENSFDFNVPFHRAILAHGPEHFECEILESFDIDDAGSLKRVLDERETYYIDRYQSFINLEDEYGKRVDKGYNATMSGSEGSKVFISEEMKDLIVDLYTEQNMPLWKIEKNIGISVPTFRSVFDERNIPLKEDTSERDSQMCRLYEDGWTYKQLEEFFGLSKGGVQKALARSGAEKKVMQPRKTKVYDINENTRKYEKEILEYREQNPDMSVRKIAEHFTYAKVPRSQIGLLLREHGYSTARKEGTSVNSKPVFQIDEQTNKVIEMYRSARDAAEAVGMKSSTSITDVINRPEVNKSGAGYAWTRTPTWEQLQDTEIGNVIEMMKDNLLKIHGWNYAELTYDQNEIMFNAARDVLIGDPSYAEMLERISEKMAIINDRIDEILINVPEMSVLYDENALINPYQGEEML